jgi:hypothetical protein
MRLGQVEGKEEPGKAVKDVKSGTEMIETLKGLQQEMHTTMLQADIVMRRLAQILDNL